MKSLNEAFLYHTYPKLDLHGLDRDTARVYINDFVRENVKLKKEVILIVHGNGSGILSSVTNETLKKNKMVKEYKKTLGNPGCTIALLCLTEKR